MKILIVGAGPVGCYTAQLLKSMGYHPALIEEHLILGQPIHCSGIVSSDLLTLVESYLSDDAVISRINGFSINTPWEEEFFIKKDGVAVILDRERFDFYLGRGLEINLGERVSTINEHKDCYVVQTEQGKKYEADILIGADGVDSIVRRYLLQNYYQDKSSNEDPLDYYFGLQYQIRLSRSIPRLTKDVIQLYIPEEVPFFLWMILQNEHMLRIGIISEQGKKILQDFIKAQEITGEVIHKVSGRIPVGLIPTHYKNVALVGDAAGQVKPLTGGGLSYGLQSAQILAECIGKGQLVQYDKLWKKKFGSEIKFGLHARKIYEHFDEDQRRELFGLFRRNANFIEKMADFDHHSQLFREVYRSPQMLKDVGKLFRFYLEDLVRRFSE